MSGVVGRFAVAIAVATASLLAGTSARAQTQSVQQQFEAATGFSLDGKWAESLQAWDALEHRLGNGRSLAIVRVRKGEALMKLGRIAEAEVSLRAGLGALPIGDASLQEDRYLATYELGAIAERGLDYAEAVKLYRAADGIAPDNASRIRTLSGAIRTGMFFDAQTALADAEAAMPLASGSSKEDRQLRGQVRTLKARVLLNLRRFREARKELETATGELGGLTLTVDAADIAARSDNAIAASLSGAPEQAREYLGYTGAGRTTNQFNAAAAMVPPPCGGEDDLRPDDVAVVEFSILEDGSVGRAAPIYSSRQGKSALAFARAVLDWSWSQEKAQAIPAFFRLLTRVELRCSTAAQRPSIVALLNDDLNEWLDQNGVEPWNLEEQVDAKRARLLKTELDRRALASGTASLQVLQVLVLLVDNPVVPQVEKAGYVERALVIVRSQHAPAAVLAALGIRRAQATWFAKDVKEARRALREFLADPVIHSDPRASAAVLLYDALALDYGRDKRDTSVIELGQVRDMPGLDPRDPIRTAALVRLASLELLDGDVAAAQAAFDASGLDTEQCALLDAGPRLKLTKASSNDYPDEALRWGFEGWVKTEYDILASGHTTNVRAVVAFPPFVFNDAATGIMTKSVFEATFRPGSTLGCGGRNQSVVFNMR